MASKSPSGALFAAHHRHDRTVIAGLVLAIWLAILAGFGIDMVRRAQGGSLSFPLIVHLQVSARGPLASLRR